MKICEISIEIEIQVTEQKKQFDIYSPMPVRVAQTRNIYTLRRRKKDSKRETKMK